MVLAVFDYIIIALVLLSAFFGIWRGFLREVLSLLVWFLSLYLSMIFSPKLMHFLQPVTDNQKVQYVVATIILFIAILVLGSLLVRTLSRSVRAVGLGFFDRLLGLVFGAARGGVFTVILILIIQSTALANEDWYSGSAIVPYFEPVVLYFDDIMPVKFAEAAHWFKQVAKVEHVSIRDK